MVRAAAYKAKVQSTLDCVSVSWNPFTNAAINILESGQRRSARFVRNNYTDQTPGCVTTTLESLNWIPLTTRRNDKRLIMLFKLQHSLLDIVDCTILHPNDQRTRGAYRLYQPPATLSVYKYSFFPRIISNWNRRPTRVTDCHSLEEFKAVLTFAAISYTPAY